MCRVMFHLCGVVAALGAVNAVRLTPEWMTGDASSNLSEADVITAGEVRRCSIGNKVVWRKPNSEGAVLLSLWVRSGIEVTFFVFPLFKIMGTFSPSQGESGVLSVTSFEQDPEAQADSEMMQGVKNWKQGTELTVQFADAASGIITGENVVMELGEARIEEENDDNNGDGDDVQVAQDAPKYAVKILLISSKDQTTGTTPGILVRLDHQTLFKPGAGGFSGEIVLPNVTAGKRVHVVLENNTSIRCKFKVVFQSNAVNGERQKVCFVGQRWLVMFKSTPMEKYLGADANRKNPWQFTNTGVGNNGEETSEAN